MKKLFYLFIILNSTAWSQVGINILIPDSSAVLQLESNNKGLGLSRLNSSQRDAITNPLKGLTIYNTEDSVIEYWNGECWLKVWEKNCYYCDFTMTIDDQVDTLDRLVSDSVFSTISINRINGSDPISVIYLAVMPPGISAYFNGPTTIDSNGTLDIIVKADLCSPVSGNIPFIIQAFCGDQIRFVTYNVHIRGPKLITIPVDETDYNLQQANAVILPSGTSQFAIVTINQGVEMHSSDIAIPSFTTGNLAANSLICLVNNGALLGRGGDGGAFQSGIIQWGGVAGEQGGNALNLTCRTVIVNNGSIYGGGSGGSSVGFGIQIPIPIINQNLNIGVMMGGGGGSELGAGGSVTAGGIGLGVFNDGQAATGTIASVPGQGGTASATIPINISIATINITPIADAGDGGGFGQTGTNGFLDVQLEVCVSIPIIGNICIGIPIPGGFLPIIGPTAPDPGLAIKRNSNPLFGLVDGTYFTTQIKGGIVP